MSRRLGPLAALFLAALLASGTAADAEGQAPAPKAGGPRQARLERGPEPVKGLPFFAPNAIAALSGLYSAGGGSVRVYSCRAELFFGPDWQALPRGELPATASAKALSALVRDRGGRPVIALRAQSYTLFIELPRYAPDLVAFAFAFADRFAPFFSAAPSDAELSFPAFVPY